MIALRPARPEDSEYFLDLRNDPVTVRMSRRAEAVGEAEHATWFAHALTDPDLALFVAETAPGQPVGTGRVTFGQGGAELSLVIAPEARGAGYGRALIHALAAEAARRGVRRVWAEVKPENLASLRAFLGAGFTGGLVRLERSL